jgi:hypothetical protein
MAKMNWQRTSNAEEDNGEEIMTPEDANVDLDALYADYAAAVAAGMFEDTLVEAPVMVIPPAEATILDAEYADILEMVTEMSMRPAKAAIQDIVLDVEALEAPVMVIPPAEVFSQADILDIERCKAHNEATDWAEYKTWWERTGNDIDEPFEKVRALSWRPLGLILPTTIRLPSGQGMSYLTLSS